MCSTVHLLRVLDAVLPGMNVAMMGIDMIIGGAARRTGGSLFPLTLRQLPSVCAT